MTYQGGRTSVDRAGCARWPVFWLVGRNRVNRTESKFQMGSVYIFADREHSQHVSLRVDLEQVNNNGCVINGCLVEFRAVSGADDHRRTKDYVSELRSWKLPFGFPLLDVVITDSETILSFDASGWE